MKELEKYVPGRGPYVTMFSGTQWHPEDPHVEDVRLADFPSLAHICRWGGQTRAPYSVAQHSYHVAHYLGETGQPPGVIFQGLIHDLHEVYPPGDWLSPVKCDDARHIARMARATLRKALGVPEEFDPAVKHADRVLRATERRDLMHPSTTMQEDLPEPWRRILRPHSAKRAWAMFLGMWVSLRGSFT